MKINKTVLILFLVFTLAFFLRFYQLGQIPNGLYQDETAIGYNAYSLIQTGKDEYGKTMPLYFKSFGDWKLPIYIYSTIAPIEVFGLNAFAVRFPSAFFGFLTVIVFYFFVADVTKKGRLALIATTLLVINPWSLHYNRATFEVSICLFLFVLGGYLLNKFFQKNISGLFFAATICFLLALYAYNLTRLLAPVLFALFLFYHKNSLKKASKKEMILSALVTIIALIPFAKTLFGEGGASSAGGTLLFSSAAVQAPLHEFRWFANFLGVLPSALFFNKYVLLGWQYVTNIVSYFSVPFFFVTGSQHGNHGIGNVGQLYLFEFPLVIAGIIYFFKKKIAGFSLLTFWAAAVILVASLTRDIPHATRSFFLVVPLEIFSAAGLFYLFTYLKGLTFKPVKFILIIGISLAIGFNLLYYFTSYYLRFPIVYAKSWRLDDREVSLYLKENEQKYDRILIDKKAGFMYTSLLFYLSYSPEKFQQTVVRLPDDSEGFSTVVSFGKYEIRDIDWSQDVKTPKTLIISRNENKPNDVSGFKVFYFPERYTAFPVGQELFEYPVHDLSYVLVTTQ